MTLFSSGDGQLPKYLHSVKELNEKEEFGNVGAWWHGLRVTEIVAEVGSKTIASLDRVLNVGIRHIIIGPKAKVVDEGEEHFDEVWERQVGVIGGDGAPNPGCCATLPACDHSKPQLEKDVL